MSRLGVFPIAVLMQRQRLQNRWVDETWRAIRVAPAAAAAADTASPQGHGSMDAAGGGVADSGSDNIRTSGAADAGRAIQPGNIIAGVPSADLADGTADEYIVGGLELELFADDDDGYFENWAAPEPKVFILWRMQDERAIPVRASVSYAEGARMLDSGESVDGVPMPQEVHAWLGEYLRMHYRPPRKPGRH